MRSPRSRLTLQYTTRVSPQAILVSLRIKLRRLSIRARVTIMLSLGANMLILGDRSSLHTSCRRMLTKPPQSQSIQAPQLKPWLKSPSPLTELRTNVVAGTPADPGPSRAARRNNVLFGASHSEESLTFQPTLPSPPAKSRLMNVVIGTPTDPEPSSATQRNNARALFGASDSEESVTSASLQPTDGWPTMGQPPRSETSSGPRSLRETLLPSSPSGVLSSSATEKRGKDKQELAVEVRREAKGATSQLKKIPTSEMANEASSYKKRIDASQISVLANFEESGPNLGGQHLYRPLRIHGSSSYGLSIVKAASHLERTLNGWASEVLRIAPTPAVALQEAVLTDTTHVGENTALFTVVRPMTVHYLLRHALAQVISEGIINSLLVTNSVEANLGFTRAHERLLTRDAKAATFWRRLTFSIAVENPTPEMMRLIFEQNMPLLAALLPDSAEDALGTRTMLRAAFRFSCMLRGENANSEAFYSSFVPKVTSTLDLGVIDLVKPCRRSERGEVDRVGVTIFPGLIEVMPMLPTGVVRMVVRRAQVICECELLATSDPV
ncbi:hypothetical protein EI94DRAFT_1122479 [Lactarius quietus]|nr:hypothetical protein EI94DRAFT_1122479 [Lactarius quietus]